MNAARALTFLVVLGVLAVTGWATSRWIEPTWQEIRADEPALQARSLSETLGRGLTFGLLGGFRAIMADFLWVEMNRHWEAEDLPATQKVIELVTTVDPRPLYFWINGARMIAYDMPHWRVRAAAGAGPVPVVVQRRIDEEQAWVALGLLERALATHPRHPLLLIEIANIHLRRRDDLATAGEYYRLAAEAPGAPYYAARIHAELLKRQGRLREALEWLRAIHPTLPPDNEQANADVVLQRIRELEKTLHEPESEQYHPGLP